MSRMRLPISRRIVTVTTRLEARHWNQTGSRRQTAPKGKSCRQLEHAILSSHPTAIHVNQTENRGCHVKYGRAIVPAWPS
jgi:hypothetical protein